MVGATALLAGAHTSLFYGHLVDDAYITFRFADNLASGHGVVWNRGEAPIEGYTNFSWMLLSALARALGLSPHRVMLVVGLVCGVGCVAVCVLAARHLAGAREGGEVPRAAGAVAGLFAATCTGLALYATTGLETALHTLLFTCGAFALVQRRPLVFGALVGAAFLTRPEAGLLGVVGLAFFALSPARSEARWRDLVKAASVMAAIVLPYLAFKALTFGSIFPNTLAGHPGCGQAK